MCSIDARGCSYQQLDPKTLHVEMRIMKRLLAVVAMLGIMGLGINLSAQQPPAAQTEDSTQQKVGTQNQQRSAQSYEGKITKSGDKLVLQDSASQTAYQLDDQAKAKPFEGQTVKIMATMDSSTNTLHVVDITPSTNR
jgi:hypothetical protein